MYPTLISGSSLGESILNGKSNSARSSMNENCGAKFGKKIVENNSVYEEQQQQQPPNRDKRNSFANPAIDPEEEMVMLSPNTLTSNPPIICHICKKVFQRDQNLELHKRSHKLPCNLKKRSQLDKKKVYLCPITTCLRHRPSRALGDISGIKKHFSRKHCPKRFKCPKCSKAYAIQSDMRAHMNNCGASDYKCDCGSLFQRNDAFDRHNQSCEVALAAKTARAWTSHPQLVTSSKANSTTTEIMNHYYLANKSLPPGSHLIPMHHHHQLIPHPHPQGFPSINHYYNQVTSTSPASAQPLSLPFPTLPGRDSINYALSGEPHQNLTVNSPGFNAHASPFPADQFLTPQFPGERNVDYTTSQENMQNYNMSGIGSVDTPEMALLQMNNMMDGSSSVGGMMMSTMSPLQMAEPGAADGLTLNGDPYFEQKHYEPPSRDFVGFSAFLGGGDGGGSGGGINLSSMGGYGGEGGVWLP